jgi:hypothetical protein
LRECFDEGDTKRPDIGGRSGRFGRRGGDFGSVVSVRFAEGLTRLSDWTDGVGRKLELIADSKEIGRLDVGVDIELGVEIGENVHNGIEHIACFIGSEGALRKNLPQIFFGAFHDNVEKAHAFQATAAPVKEAQETRMRQLRDLVPDGKLLAGGGIVGRNKFDGSLTRLRVGELREEDRAVIGGSEEMVKRELVVGQLAFPLFPNIAHSAPLPV